jgi:hypothetical protein
VVQSTARLKIVHISNQGRIIGVLWDWLGISVVSNFHTEGIVGKVENILMNQNAATDPLTIDSGTICASQIPNQQTFRRPNQNAMKFGNTFMIKL